MPVAGIAAAEGFEGLLRLPALEDVDAAGVDRVGGYRDIQAPGGDAGARDQVTPDGDRPVPSVWIDLGAPGDDRHEEVLAFKTQGGR